MSSVKSLQSSFLEMIQSYKNLFNTAYMRIQQNQNPLSQQAMLEKKMLVDNFYQSYKNIINTIDSLQQVNTEHEPQSSNNGLASNNKQTQQFIVPAQLNSHSSGQNIGGLNSVQSKYDKYEREICQAHDKAVHRYKKAILSADVWKQKLYTFINENLPAGNH